MGGKNTLSFIHAKRNAVRIYLKLNGLNAFSNGADHIHLRSKVPLNIMLNIGFHYV